MAEQVTPIQESEARDTKGGLKPGVEVATMLVRGKEYTTYARVEFVDDVDNDVTGDVQTLQFAAPKWIEPEKDDNGKPVVDDDGNVSEGYWKSERYEIDLGKKNREALINALKPFADAGREYREVVTYAPAPRRTSAPRASSEEIHKIREWAKKEGIPVSERGRIAADVKERYERAQKAEKEREARIEAEVQKKLAEAQAAQK